MARGPQQAISGKFTNPVDYRHCFLSWSVATIYLLICTPGWQVSAITLDAKFQVCPVLIHGNVEPVRVRQANHKLLHNRFFLFKKSQQQIPAAVVPIGYLRLFPGLTLTQVWLLAQPFCLAAIGCRDGAAWFLLGIDGDHILCSYRLAQCSVTILQ